MKTNWMTSLGLALGLASVSLSAAPVADFTLPRVNGEGEFKLSDHRGEYVALHFLLKTECPICLKHTRDYAKRAPLAPGARHVFLKPDTRAEIQEWTDNLGEEVASMVPIYRDAGAALAERMNIPDGYEFHGQVVHYPAFVLINPRGEEIFRYVGKNNSDRLPFERFAAKMKELNPNQALKDYNLPDNQLAVEGYDVVSYFNGRPTEGSPAITEEYRGVTYRFASGENQARFVDDPAKYAPTYGGWCATAMAEGDKVEIDPLNYKVTNDRLFLFYKGFFSDAKKAWNKNEAKLTREADAEWRRIAGE